MNCGYTFNIDEYQMIIMRVYSWEVPKAASGGCNSVTKTREVELCRVHLPSCTGMDSFSLAGLGYILQCGHSEVVFPAACIPDN